ncbi:DUF2608 domain-containing protein [Candidatus Tisiphia endosymbiont of Hybos culiciformis]|uniref:DUF2608 domain-containing protein n=1 Tax=Candidatus Tisiphia endosymbiont of Hybos culiciformis TaxID=3139331 RepID=UPI003CCAEBD9
MNILCYFQEKLPQNYRAMIIRETTLKLYASALKSIANPTNITPNSQTSLRGATLVATKQSIKVIRNGLLRRFMPPRNDASLLWLNANRVSYIKLFKKFMAYTLLLLPLIAYGKIVNTDSLEQINKEYEELCNNYSPEDILLVLGRDKVIFKSFFPPINQLNKNELSKLSELFKSIKSSKVAYIDTILFTEYKNELLDNNLPKFIKDVMDKGSPVIVSDRSLTGNFNNIKKLEVWKADYLKKFNIDLSKSFPQHNYLIFNNMEPFDNTYPTFYQGILSSNNNPSFGLILNFLIEVKFMPKVLIMVDENSSELNVMESQLRNYDNNVMFIGYNYRLSDTKESIFSSHDFIKLFNELVNKVNATKRNNAKIKVKNQKSINPYDNKK